MYKVSIVKYPDLLTELRSIANFNLPDDVKLWLVIERLKEVPRSKALEGLIRDMIKAVRI